MFGLGLGWLGQPGGGSGSYGIWLSAATVADDAANSTAVGTAAISGAYTGTPTWGITGATGTFTINSSSGAITVSGNTDLTAQGEFIITIAVSGTTPDPADADFEIWVIPTAPVIDLADAEDTGASNSDDITSVTQPTLTVTANWHASDTWQWYKDSVAFGAAHLVLAGDVSAGELQIPSALADGTYDITAILSRGPVASEASAALSITIDTVAPTILNASVTSADTSADLTAYTDTASGTLYWVVDADSTTPTAAQVKAGTNAIDAAAEDSGSVAVSGLTAGDTATGLTPFTQYRAYFMQEDVAGNQSDVFAWIFTTQVSEGAMAVNAPGTLIAGI